MAHCIGNRTFPRWRFIGTVFLLLAAGVGCDGADSDDTALGIGTAGMPGGNAAGLGGNAAGLGGNAAGLGGNAAGLGGNAAGLGGSASGLGGSAATGGTGATTTGGGSLSAVAAEYLAATNAVRATVTQPSSYTGTWTALPNVSWSDTVAASAQAWADNLATNNNCNLEHEDQNTYGENLAAGSNLTPTAAVNLWAKEASLYTWSATYTMADFNKGSGHYTQLVWRQSIQIGCGSASCGNAKVISCRYSPPGNMLGSSVY